MGDFRLQWLTDCFFLFFQGRVGVNGVRNVCFCTVPRFLPKGGRAPPGSAPASVPPAMAWTGPRRRVCRAAPPSPRLSRAAPTERGRTRTGQSEKPRHPLSDGKTRLRQILPATRFFRGQISAPFCQEIFSITLHISSTSFRLSSSSFSTDWKSILGYSQYLYANHPLEYASFFHPSSIFLSRYF